MSTIPHSLLLHGLPGVGKAGIALEFARRLICSSNTGVACGVCADCRLADQLQHPDLHLIFPLPTKNRSDEKESEVIERVSDQMVKAVDALSVDAYAPTFLPKSKSRELGGFPRVSEDRIRVELVRLMLREASLKPFQAARKVFVIFHAETMIEQAQNAFLKSLEDPPEQSYFVLVCDNLQEMLPTIRSRCQKISVPPLPVEDLAPALMNTGLTQDAARAVALLSGGSMTRARQFAGAAIAALQDRAIAFLRCAAMGDALELPTRVSELTDTENLPANAELELLAILMRDVATLKAGGSVNEITFSAHRETLLRIARSYPAADLDGIVVEIDAAAHELERNLNTDWVYYSMATKLQCALGARAAS